MILTISSLSKEQSILPRDNSKCIFVKNMPIFGSRLFINYPAYGSRALAPVCCARVYDKLPVVHTPKDLSYFVLGVINTFLQKTQHAKVFIRSFFFFFRENFKQTIDISIWVIIRVPIV